MPLNSFFLVIQVTEKKMNKTELPAVSHEHWKKIKKKMEYWTLNIEIKYMHTEYEAYNTCFWCKLKPSTISFLSALLIFFFMFILPFWSL